MRVPYQGCFFIKLDWCDFWIYHDDTYRYRYRYRYRCRYRYRYRYRYIMAYSDYQKSGVCKIHQAFPLDLLSQTIPSSNTQTCRNIPIYFDDFPIQKQLKTPENRKMFHDFPIYFPIRFPIYFPAILQYFPAVFPYFLFPSGHVWSLSGYPPISTCHPQSPCFFGDQARLQRHLDAHLERGLHRGVIHPKC